MARVTVNMTQSVTGLPFQLVGTADTLAAARAEAQAKAALTVGAVVSVSESEDVADISAYVAAAGDDADCVIILGKDGNANRPIKVTNATKAIALANGKGRINIAHPLVTAFAGAYRDGDGDGGYSAVGGQFEK